MTTLHQNEIDCNYHIWHIRWTVTLRKIEPGSFKLMCTLFKRSYSVYLLSHCKLYTFTWDCFAKVTNLWYTVCKKSSAEHKQWCYCSQDMRPSYDNSSALECSTVVYIKPLDSHSSVDGHSMITQLKGYQLNYKQ